MNSNKKILFFTLLIGGLYMLTRHFNYFKFSEFADKISGENNMNPGTIARLDRARAYAGIPFVINSGYRDENHPETLKNPTSSHNKGFAVDIRYTNQTEKDKILDGIRRAGFTRIGIGSNFIHADDDPNKNQNVTWFYDGRPSIWTA